MMQPFVTHLKTRLATPHLLKIRTTLENVSSSSLPRCRGSWKGTFCPSLASGGVELCLRQLIPAQIRLLLMHEWASFYLAGNLNTWQAGKGQSKMLRENVKSEVSNTSRQPWIRWEEERPLCRTERKHFSMSISQTADLSQFDYNIVLLKYNNVDLILSPYLSSCEEPGGGWVLCGSVHVHASTGLPLRPHQHPHHLQWAETPDQRRHQPALWWQSLLQAAQQGKDTCTT